jgi:hypothetical protein
MGTEIISPRSHPRSREHSTQIGKAIPEPRTYWPRRSFGLLSEGPAFVANYAFQFARAFNLFYHHILRESDPAKKKVLLQLSRLVEVLLVAALALLGIESPEKM